MCDRSVTGVEAERIWRGPTEAAAWAQLTHDGLGPEYVLYEIR